MPNQGCISSKNKEEKIENYEKKIPEKIIEHEGDLFVKSTETKRKIDLGFKFSKLPAGLEFKTISGLDVKKSRNYEKINKKNNEENKNLNSILEEEKNKELQMNEILNEEKIDIN